MEFDLTHLDADGARVNEEFGADVLAAGGDDERFAPLGARLTAWIRPERGGARATGDLVGSLRAECDRCLKPLEVDVAAHFDQRYEWGEGRPAAGRPVAPDADEEHEVPAEELDVERLEAPVLDTAALAREQFELAEPVRVVCSEDCKGLCETCGVDLNSVDCGCAPAPGDPRWDALRNIKLN